MAGKTSDQLAQAAVDLKLIDQLQLQEIWSLLGSRNVSVKEFTETLLRRELLTGYQIGRLKRGETKGYFYGDYKLLYLVGSGSFARVYRAAHVVTDEIVALKVLRRRYQQDSKEAREARQQFQQEAELGLTLRHPNIVPIYEVGLHDTRSHFLVMEFVEGRNLREFIKIREKCEADEALRLISDVASGLDYAFQRSVSHRDIKLSNVLVSSRGTAKLVDFGLAAAGRDVADEALGNFPNPRTIDYAALERVTGVRRDDKRSDLYFVGCMLYHLLSGVAPLPDGKDRTKRLNRNRFREIAPLPQVARSVPRAAVAVVERAMELDPERRYQSPKEMLIDIELTLRKLSEPTTADVLHEDDTVVEDHEARIARRAKPQRTVMLVEANTKLQDVLRASLKSNGFRVLVTSDPKRALSRFADEARPAQCLVFSTQELAEQAIEAWDAFTSSAATAEIPAILMLGPEHGHWKDRTDGAEHHVVVRLPITMGEFRAQLDRLVPHARVIQ